MSFAFEVYCAECQETLTPAGHEFPVDHPPQPILVPYRRLGLLVDCPTCLAVPGNRCRTSSGFAVASHLDGVHGRRIEAFRILRRVARALTEQGASR